MPDSRMESRRAPEPMSLQWRNGGCWYFRGGLSRKTTRRPAQHVGQTEWRREPGRSRQRKHHGSPSACSAICS